VLEKHDVSLFAVSIGTKERASDFVTETRFPAAALFADPESRCYDSLKLNKSLSNFSQKSTPEKLVERWRKDGAKDLINVLKRWKPWTPPKPEQGFQQGGAFVFARSTDSNGNSKIENLYRFYDPSTGVSAPFDDVLRAAGCGGLDRDVEAVPRELRGSK